MPPPMQLQIASHNFSLRVCAKLTTAPTALVELTRPPSYPTQRGEAQLPQV